MSNSLSFHLLVLIPLLANAGCRAADAAPDTCSGPVEIRSHADVDAASSCTSIDGDLRITGGGVTDLRGLEALSRVRYVVIVGTSLESLEGLSGLTEIEGITVAANPRLRSLRGLDGVRELDGLVVVGNERLFSLAGLEALQRADELTIAGNPRLASLAALASLTQVVELDVPAAGSAFAGAEADALARRTSRPVALGR